MNEDEEDDEVEWSAERGDIAGGKGWGLTRKRGRRWMGDRGRERGFRAAAADFRVYQAMQTEAKEEHKRAWAAWEKTEMFEEEGIVHSHTTTCIYPGVQNPKP